MRVMLLFGADLQCRDDKGWVHAIGFVTFEITKVSDKTEGILSIRYIIYILCHFDQY